MEVVRPPPAAVTCYIFILSSEKEFDTIEVRDDFWDELCLANVFDHLRQILDSLSHVFLHLDHLGDIDYLEVFDKLLNDLHLSDFRTHYRRAQAL